MAGLMLDCRFPSNGVCNVSDVYAPLDDCIAATPLDVSTYVHDKWQLRQKLTVDLGLRHEYYTPVVGFHDRGGMANYDPETNTLRVAGYGDIPANLGVESYWLNFNPRTGISWRLNDSNVIRAGYGVSAEGGPSSRGQIYPVAQHPDRGTESYTSPAHLDRDTVAFVRSDSRQRISRPRSSASKL